jgi:AAA+ ATPase superfamily predicted ATPase
MDNTIKNGIAVKIAIGNPGSIDIEFFLPNSFNFLCKRYNEMKNITAIKKARI